MAKILPAINTKNALCYVALLVLGIGCVLVAARKLNPTPYTEDGQWLGMGISDGWQYSHNND